MKLIAATALVLTSSSLMAVSAAAFDTTPGAREHRVCTQIQRRGGSRLAYQRLCLTETEWRARLGTDWRQVLAGRSPEDDIAGLDAMSRSSSDMTAYGHPTTSVAHAPR